VRIQEVTDEIAKAVGLDHAQGALVASMTDGGPAQSAGIQTGDVILNFGGTPVERVKELPCLVADFSPGQVVRATLLRAKGRVEREIKVGRLVLASSTSQPSPIQCNGTINHD